MKLGAILSGPSARDKADRYRDDRNWIEAVKYYRRHLRTHRNEAHTWVQLGNMLKECGEFTQSESAYRSALNLQFSDPDIFLQLGHLAKLQGKIRDAEEHYLQAISREPVNFHALGELENMGLGQKAEDIILKSAAISDEIAERVIFDVSDLVYYIGHHDNLSGIQRVQSCIIQAIIKYEIISREKVTFTSFDAHTNSFEVIDTDSFLELLSDLSLPTELRNLEFNKLEARDGRLFQKGPLVTAMSATGVTFVLLGAAWVIPDYPTKIANLKRRFSARFVMVFHDFIPIFAKETCDQGTAEVFKEFVDQILRLTDVALCVSQSTERDLKRYCAEIGVDAPPSFVTRLGSGFHEFFEESSQAGKSLPDLSKNSPYVLFVSTIEGRKNHQYVLDIWLEMQRRGVDVPRLLWVGRLGWRAESAIQTLLETDYIGGKVDILEDISDIELKALYDGALFTVYPSIYEGWGLPVSESLSNGKVCVLSDRTSLPEVAGDFGVYIPLGNKNIAADTIENLLDNPEELLRREEDIRDNFEPISWRTVAETVIHGCDTARKHPSRCGFMVVEPGLEYTLRQLRVQTHGLMGNAMLDSLTRAHAGVLLPGTIKIAQKVQGLLARSRDWYAAEDWGTWARGRRARVQFALDPADLDHGEDLLLCTAMDFLKPVLPARVRIDVNGNMLNYERDACAENSIIVWPISMKNVHYSSNLIAQYILLDIGFEIIFYDDSIVSECRQIDTRNIFFGLRSFSVLKETDLAGRLKMAEMHGYKLNAQSGEAVA